MAVYEKIKSHPNIIHYFKQWNEFIISTLKKQKLNA